MGVCGRAGVVGWSLRTTVVLLSAVVSCAMGVLWAAVVSSATVVLCAAVVSCATVVLGAAVVVRIKDL